MRKIFMILLSMIAIVANAADNDGIEKVGKVIDNKNSQWDYIIGGLGIGFNQSVKAPKGTDVQFFKSLNYTMLFASGIKYKVPNTKNSFNFGLGIDWRTYRACYPSKCFVSNNGVVQLGDYPEDVIPKYSQIRTFTLMLPLLWRQHLSLKLPKCGNMSLLVGPIVDFTIHGSLTNAWVNLQGNEVHQSTNNIGQHKIAIELFAALYINQYVGIYARYTPMHVLKSPNLPFTSFSSGLILAF